MSEKTTKLRIADMLLCITVDEDVARAGGVREVRAGRADQAEVPLTRALVLLETQWLKDHREQAPSDGI